MQKPTLCIYTKLHAHNVRESALYTHGHLLLPCFEIIDCCEISQVSTSQKQALVNAIKYVCNPTLECSHTSQREFAAAKLQKYFDVNKF